MPETDSEDDKEPLPTADLYNPVWDEELVPDRRKSCIHEIPRPATPPPQSVSATHPHSPRGPSHIAPAADQVAVAPEFELMELDISEDISDLLDVSQEVMPGPMM